MTGRTEDLARDLFLERFKGNLIRARHAAGMSQAMLGVETDLHPTAISKLKRGERLPRLDTAVRLASALGVSVAQLVAGYFLAGAAGPPGGTVRAGGSPVSTRRGPMRQIRTESQRGHSQKPRSKETSKKSRRDPGQESRNRTPGASQPEPLTHYHWVPVSPPKRGGDHVQPPA